MTDEFVRDGVIAWLVAVALASVMALGECAAEARPIDTSDVRVTASGP